MAEAISNILDHPEKYADIGRLASKRVEDFSPDNIFYLYKTLFERISGEDSY